MKEALSIQPNNEIFIKLGKQDDYIFQALAHIGKASHLMSWANTCLMDVAEVPHEMKSEMILLTTALVRMQERLREISKAESIEQ
ncbi:hypothetical protein [Paenibacillus ginsengihumi]|uniref:hypothetical protein n=1 Tax=Paenibacillus ginsengihumi TaxID=431596 RepID=UPI00037719CC|nr:hypothetical protein [Paenibacillus ginsengihumi]